MRIASLLLIAVLLSGCFVVLKDNDKVKVYGNSKEIALDTLQKTEDTKPEAKHVVHWFGK